MLPANSSSLRCINLSPAIAAQSKQAILQSNVPLAFLCKINFCCSEESKKFEKTADITSSQRRGADVSAPSANPRQNVDFSPDSSDYYDYFMVNPRQNPVQKQTIPVFRSELHELLHTQLSQQQIQPKCLENFTFQPNNITVDLDYQISGQLPENLSSLADSGYFPEISCLSISELLQVFTEQLRSLEFGQPRSSIGANSPAEFSVFNCSTLERYIHHRMLSYTLKTCVKSLNFAQKLLNLGEFHWSLEFVPVSNKGPILIFKGTYKLCQVFITIKAQEGPERDRNQPREGQKVENSPLLSTSSSNIVKSNPNLHIFYENAQRKKGNRAFLDEVRSENAQKGARSLNPSHSSQSLQEFLHISEYKEENSDFLHLERKKFVREKAQIKLQRANKAPEKVPGPWEHVTSNSFEPIPAKIGPKLRVHSENVPLGYFSDRNHKNLIQLPLDLCYLGLEQAVHRCSPLPGLILDIIQGITSLETVKLFTRQQHKTPNFAVKPSEKQGKAPQQRILQPSASLPLLKPLKIMRPSLKIDGPPGNSSLLGAKMTQAQEDLAVDREFQRLHSEFTENFTVLPQKQGIFNQETPATAGFTIRTSIFSRENQDFHDSVAENGPTPPENQGIRAENQRISAEEESNLAISVPARENSAKPQHFLGEISKVGSAPPIQREIIVPTLRKSTSEQNLALIRPNSPVQSQISPKLALAGHSKALSLDNSLMKAQNGSRSAEIGLKHAPTTLAGQISASSQQTPAPQNGSIKAHNSAQAGTQELESTIELEQVKISAKILGSQSEGPELAALGSIPVTRPTIHGQNHNSLTGGPTSGAPPTVQRRISLVHGQNKLGTLAKFLLATQHLSLLAKNSAKSANLEKLQSKALNSQENEPQIDESSLSTSLSVAPQALQGTNPPLSGTFLSPTVPSAHEIAPHPQHFSLSLRRQVSLGLFEAESLEDKLQRLTKAEFFQRIKENGQSSENMGRNQQTRSSAVQSALSEAINFIESNAKKGKIEEIQGNSALSAQLEPLAITISPDSSPPQLPPLKFSDSSAEIGPNLSKFDSPTPSETVKLASSPLLNLMSASFIAALTQVTSPAPKTQKGPKSSLKATKLAGKSLKEAKKPKITKKKPRKQRNLSDSEGNEENFDKIVAGQNHNKTYKVAAAALKPLGTQIGPNKGRVETITENSKEFRPAAVLSGQIQAHFYDWNANNKPVVLKRLNRVKFAPDPVTSSSEESEESPEATENGAESDQESDISVEMSAESVAAGVLLARGANLLRNCMRLGCTSHLFTVDKPNNYQIIVCSYCEELFYCSQQCAAINWTQSSHKTRCTGLSQVQKPLKRPVKPLDGPNFVFELPGSAANSGKNSRINSARLSKRSAGGSQGPKLGESEVKAGEIFSPSLSGVGPIIKPRNSKILAGINANNGGGGHKYLREKAILEALQYQQQQQQQQQANFKK
jgi:hypothetical protein